MPINKLPDPPVSEEFKDPSWKQWFQSLSKWNRQEGYFTPTFTGLTVGGVGGVVTQYAHWYKYGNRVHISGHMSPNGTATITFAAWSGCYLTNPPFLVAASNNKMPINCYGGLFMSSSLTSSGQVWAFGNSATNQGRIYFTTGATTTAGENLYWHINYQTDQ